MYFVSIVDDYFRSCSVYPMRQRVEALELLVKWKNLMKNQTGRKIKVLRYDHIEEYKNSFLQFGQNNGGVAKEINHALLEKVRYLLSNASLDKSFWAKAT